MIDFGGSTTRGKLLTLYLSCLCNIELPSLISAIGIKCMEVVESSKCSKYGLVTLIDVTMLPDSWIRADSLFLFCRYVTVMERGVPASHHVSSGSASVAAIHGHVPNTRRRAARVSGRRSLPAQIPQSLQQTVGRRAGPRCRRRSAASVQSRILPELLCVWITNYGSIFHGGVARLRRVFIRRRCGFYIATPCQSNPCYINSDRHAHVVFNIGVIIRIPAAAGCGCRKSRADDVERFDSGARSALRMRTATVHALRPATLRCHGVHGPGR